MTRARLDSVVIVVDGDAMAQDAQQGIEPCVIAIQQLECADVVLLNKIDLLTDDAKQLAQDVIKKYAPLARVYETDHCEVYLPHILDISPPEAMNTAVITHETSNLHWNKGSETTVGRLRIVQDSNSTSSTYSHSSSHRHLDFKSVSFEQVQPIYLYQMHHWIDKQLPKGILRAKGVFYFADDPTNRFVFQLSGRKRIQIENTGRWISAPKNQFIVIGTQMDEAIVVEQLEATLASIQDDEIKDQQTRQENLTLLHQDDRFEIQQEECKYSVRFRLKCPTSGLDENMLRHHHHVDTNQLTKRLVEEVNSAGTGGLLAYLNHPGTNGESLFVAMASIYGPSSLQTMWKEIDTRAAFIITEVKRKLVGCKCGF
jgi:G3E family GTPase